MDCFYFYWEVGPNSHFPDVLIAPEAVFIYDLFTKAEVSGQAKLFKVHKTIPDSH